MKKTCCEVTWALSEPFISVGLRKYVVFFKKTVSMAFKFVNFNITSTDTWYNCFLKIIFVDKKICDSAQKGIPRKITDLLNYEDSTVTEKCGIKNPTHGTKWETNRNR